MRTRAFWLCLLLVAVCYSQEPAIKLPAEIRGAVGQPIDLQAETTGKIVRWHAPDAGLEMVNPEKLKDSKTAIVWSLKPGNYRLLAWTALGDVPSHPAVCVVVVGGEIPSDFAKDLKKAYIGEKDADKADTMKKLAALYRQSAETAQLHEVVNYESLFATMSAAAKTLGVSGKLPEVQKVVNISLKSLGAKKEDPVDRARTRQEFLRIATAIEEAMK